MVMVQGSGTSGGGGIDRNCGCHFVVEEFKQSQSGDVELKMTVMRATEPSQEGRQLIEFFPLSLRENDKPAKLNRTFMAAIALGIYTDKQWEELRATGGGVDLPFEEVEGREFCADVTVEPYRGPKEENQGKSFPKIGFGIYSLDSPKGAHIPKDMDSPGVQALLKRGIKVPQPGQTHVAGGAAGGSAGANAASRPNGSGSNSGGGRANPSAAGAGRSQPPKSSAPAGSGAGAVDPNAY